MLRGGVGRMPGAETRQTEKKGSALGNGHQRRGQSLGIAEEKKGKPSQVSC